MIKCYDKFRDLISPGDIVNVQSAGNHKVYLKNGELYFTPYGKEDKVCDYFMNDMVIVMKDTVVRAIRNNNIDKILK